MPDRAMSETEAANAALRHLGQPPIADLATGTDIAARECRAAFGLARDTALAEKDWNFATGWADLALSATPADGPLPNAFPLPDDCIKVRSVEDADDDDWDVQSQTITVAGAAVTRNVLVTCESAAAICYTRRITDVRAWSADFVLVFSLRLAALVAPMLTREISIGGALDDRADAKVDRAGRRDAREAAPRQVSRDTSWVRARR